MAGLTLTVRDRWILVVLPALALLVAYGMGAGRPLARSYRALLSEQERLDAPDRLRSNIESRRQQLPALREQLRQQQQREAASQATIGKGAIPSLSGRAAILVELARRCSEHHLVWLGAQSRGRTALGVPGWESVERWQLELRGGYQDAVGFFDSLVSDPLPILPASLEMVPAAQGVKPVDWKLVLWM